MEKFDRRLRILLEDMADTMYDADGVGLAAPQVGILQPGRGHRRGGRAGGTGEPRVIVESDGQQSGPEGCLSIPGRSGIVTRPDHVKVQRPGPRTATPIELEARGVLCPGRVP